MELPCKYCGVPTSDSCCEDCAHVLANVLESGLLALSVKLDPASVKEASFKRKMATDEAKRRARMN